MIADETASEEVESPADALFIMIGGIPVSERVEDGSVATRTDSWSPAPTFWQVVTEIAGGLSSAIPTRSRRASLGLRLPVTPVMGRSSEFASAVGEAAIAVQLVQRYLAAMPQ